MKFIRYYWRELVIGIGLGILVVAPVIAWCVDQFFKVYFK